MSIVINNKKLVSLFQGAIVQRHLKLKAHSLIFPLCKRGKPKGGLKAHSLIFPLCKRGKSKGGLAHFSIKIFILYK